MNDINQSVRSFLSDADRSGDNVDAANVDDKVPQNHLTCVVTLLDNSLQLNCQQARQAPIDQIDASNGSIE